MSDLDRLREVWTALGCERNPDDFNTTVQERMWSRALDMIRKATTKETRVYRENQALEAEVESLRAKLAAVEVIVEAFDWGSWTEPSRVLLAAIRSQESPNGSHGHDDDRTVVIPPTAGSTE